MAADGVPSWSAGEPFVNLEAMPEDDFSNFLNLENLDFNFAGLNNDAYNPPLPDAQAQRYPDYDRVESGGPAPSQMPATFEHTMPMANETQQHNGLPQYQWTSNQQYNPHNSIPPTPNSSEMYPTPYHQPTGAGQQYHDRRAYNHKANSFTPLTSPGFVDNGSSTAVHDYAMSGSQVLSPLTSPAMYAQQGLGGRGPTSVPSATAQSSMTGSPIEMDLDTMAGEAVFEERPRKTRKRDPAPKQAARLPSRKRKSSASGAKTPLRSLSSAPQASATHGTSTPASISPQPQTNISMPPPPVPLSAKNSPYIYAHPDYINGTTGSGRPPATPASLMRLAKQQSGSSDERSPTQPKPTSPGTEALGLGMEELTLPEAAAPPLPAPRPAASSAKSTPAILPRISSTAPAVVLSPRVVPYGNTSKNPAGRGGSRKRNSVLVSPALRPRISPSIKPLLPENGKSAAAIASDDTHALLLASKSNYQNLLEGNCLPGVTYPSELSTNLTSKRTSHKLAEQGRRNRINSALQEMQQLLPTPPAATSDSPAGDDSGSRCDSGSGSGNNDSSAAPKTPVITPAQAANSKAATVEQAIEYIKDLKGRLDQTNKLNEDKDAQIEALRNQLMEKSIVA